MKKIRKKYGNHRKIINEHGCQGLNQSTSTKSRPSVKLESVHIKYGIKIRSCIKGNLYFLYFASCIVHIKEINVVGISLLKKIKKKSMSTPRKDMKCIQSRKKNEILKHFH